MTMIEELEAELRALAHNITEPHERECSLCYVLRMLNQFGCTGLRWTNAYVRQRAPKVTGFQKRLGDRGGFCDCEIFLNAYRPRPGVLIRCRADCEDCDDGECERGSLPACRGARRGSTKPCELWVPRRSLRW